ncbi:MAG: polyprenyl synthetase family protein [Negativicutes bacterium]|nr:polyprenyl synthetase family protein [Negativicutes bacterium]
MLKKYLEEKKSLVEKHLEDWMESGREEAPETYEAMSYSLMAGGKRLRPILLMAAAETQGKSGEKFLDAACALEMIHTYSLIHDDLPGMDDDDYRRGRLTNHKVFGVGSAILAGDGLLTLAFEVLASQTNVSPERLIWAVKEFASSAGPIGMVQGQAMDLAAEGHKISEERMKAIHRAKTGQLFRAALRSGVWLAGGEEIALEKITEYADAFGLAFQITDDILDVIGTAEEMGKQPGNDAEHEKATYVSLYGLEAAEKMATEQVKIALNAATYFGASGKILAEIVQSLVARRQ